MVEYISCPFRTFATNSSVLSIKKAISWKLYEFISLYTSIWAFSDLDIKYGGHKTSPSMTAITLYLKLISILPLRNFTIPNLTNLWPLSVFMTFILFDFRFQNKYLVFRRDWDSTVLRLKFECRVRQEVFVQYSALQRLPLMWPCYYIIRLLSNLQEEINIDLSLNDFKLIFLAFPVQNIKIF